MILNALNAVQVANATTLALWRQQLANGALSCLSVCMLNSYAAINANLQRLHAVIAQFLCRETCLMRFETFHRDVSPTCHFPTFLVVDVQ